MELYRDRTDLQVIIFLSAGIITSAIKIDTINFFLLHDKIRGEIIVFLAYKSQWLDTSPKGSVSCVTIFYWKYKLTGIITCMQ